MLARTSAPRSWIWAGVALALGLGLYWYDDWAESVEIPIAKTILNVLEIVVMGPAMSVLAFLASEALRAKDERYRRGLEHEREKRFRFLGRIAASMAHEVRNPLHNLHLVADEMRQRASGVDRDLLHSLTANLVRLDQATRLIYTLARPPERQQADEPSPISLTELLDEVVAEVERDARPPARLARGPAAPVIADGDREAVRIVLQNLVRNATEAAVGAPVNLVCREEPDSAVVEIRNPGTMAVEAMSDDPLSPSTKAGGLGVGIAIARHLTAALGGSLRFENRDGSVIATLALPKAR
jgi:signal transduction histidine kinase